MTEALLKNNLYTLFGNGRAEKNLDTNKNIKSSYASFARYVYCISFFCMLETIVCSSETTLDTVPIDIVELNDIKINDNEKELIDTLKKFCENREIWGDQEVVPRIAGGWVRDKLSGRESNDIDIAEDTMSGYDFARKFFEADLIQCNEPKIIQANLEMSKDIEVTTMDIGNLPVEFVQLRTGTEEAEKLPTACNDAKRRDFTINSLFYNIMTGEIEDYTNGREDIKRKILRTPVPSLETFLNCPLRVLRAMRFAVHYNLTVDDQIYHAMQNSDVKTKLNESIANERIGTEIQKITTHMNGYIGMLMLIKYGLLETIFKASTCKAKKPKKKEVSVYVHIDDPVGDKSRHEISLQFAEKLATVDAKKIKINISIFNLYTCLLHYKGLKIEKRYVNSAIVGDKLKWTLLMEKKIQNIETNIEKHNIIPEEEYDIIKMIKDMNDDWLDVLYLQYLFTGDEKWKDTIDKVIANGYPKKLKIKSIKDGNALKVIFKVDQSNLSKYMECFAIYQVIYETGDEDKLIDCVKKHFEENKQ